MAVAVVFMWLSAMLHGASSLVEYLAEFADWSAQGRCTSRRVCHRAPGLNGAGELASQMPDVAAVATNLRKPVEAALQLPTRLAADGVFRVLRSDAEILATMMTRDQALALGAADPNQDAAVWTGTPEGQERLKPERREARERYKQIWGRYPG